VDDSNPKSNELENYAYNIASKEIKKKIDILYVDDVLELEEMVNDETYQSIILYNGKSISDVAWNRIKKIVEDAKGWESRYYGLNNYYRKKQDAEDLTDQENKILVLCMGKYWYVYPSDRFKDE